MSFYLANDGGTPAAFQAYWNGTQVFNAPTYNFSFTQLRFNEVAAGNDTISFAAYQSPAYYYLDDVAVVQGTTFANATVPTPEPDSIALAGIGLLVSFAIGLRLKKSAPTNR